MARASTENIVATAGEVHAPDLSSDRKSLNVSFSTSISLAVCLGVSAGLVEGAGLLIFQQLNWRRWGPFVHVSKDILWISPIADSLVFCIIAVLLALAAKVFRRNGLKYIIFILIFFTVYDWLSLTERLYYRACVALALGVAAVFTRWWARNQDTALFSRKSLVALISVWLLMFLGIRGSIRLKEREELTRLPTAAPDAPNTIVIVIDTLRADHVSAYGYSRLTTPNLDRMAEQAALFENAISACSWTLPSHASLLTGKYPSEHGMQNVQPAPWLGGKRSNLNGYPTIGDALEKTGYRTGAFSANQTYFTSNVGLGRGFLHFEDYFESPKDMFMRTFFARDRLLESLRAALGRRWWLYTHKDAGEVNKEMLDWIGHDRRPFFAFLNYIDVHDSASIEWTNSSPQWGTSNPVDAYDSALAYVDENIGNLIQELGNRGLSRNTLIVVTSDHGESLGQHKMMTHGLSLYVEQIRVPLLFWYPGHVPSNLRITTPVSQTFVAATVMDITSNSSSPFAGPGLDQLWNNAGHATDWPEPLSELAQNDVVMNTDRHARKFVPTALDGNMTSVLTSRWHFIEHSTLGDQLFNWVDDPGETNNIIALPEGQVVAKQLSADIKSALHRK